MIRKLGTLILLVLLVFITSLAQKRQRAPVCRAATLAAFKSLPELSYNCPEGLIDSDDKILALPERRSELRRITRELESFTNAAWWNADVDELEACELHGNAGRLSAEEKEKYTSGDYRFSLFGNNSVRLALIADPCYQTGYNGSVAFLLYRNGGRVFVTKVLDGYYSRIDNSVGIDFANLNGQQIVEVSTANSMLPSVRNYYFVIDPKTHRAVSKKLFPDGKTLTNEIASAMIIGEPSDLGLPRGSEDMEVISHHQLRPSFAAYSEDFGEGDGHKLKRTVYRWNGKYYATEKVRR
jgi:hypothetical protein